MQALVTGETVQALSTAGGFRGPDGTQHPAQAWAAWDAADWRRLVHPDARVLPVRPAPATPWGQAVAGTRLAVVIASEPKDDWVEEIATYADRPLQELRQELKVLLAARRWQAECAGVAVPGIGPVRTDDRGKLMLTAAQAAGLPARWKCQDGRFVTVTADDVTGLFAQVALHVRACFDEEDRRCQAADAAPDLAALQQVEAGLDDGWPGGEG